MLDSALPKDRSTRSVPQVRQCLALATRLRVVRSEAECVEGARIRPGLAYLFFRRFLGGRGMAPDWAAIVW